MFSHFRVTTKTKIRSMKYKVTTWQHTLPPWSKWKLDDVSISVYFNLTSRYRITLSPTLVAPKSITKPSQSWSITSSCLRQKTKIPKTTSTCLLCFLSPSTFNQHRLSNQLFTYSDPWSLTDLYPFPPPFSDNPAPCGLSTGVSPFPDTHY